MPSRLDALRAQIAAAQAAPFPLVPNAEYTTCAAAAFYALPALLAVVEAAQDYRRNSIVLIGQDALGAALDTALAALTTPEVERTPTADPPGAVETAFRTGHEYAVVRGLDDADEAWRAFSVARRGAAG